MTNCNHLECCPECHATVKELREGLKEAIPFVNRVHVELGDDLTALLEKSND